MAKIRSSLYKLSILTGKWYKIKATQQLCTFCNQRTIENEFHFLLDCPNYEELRKGTFNSVAKIDNIETWIQNQKIETDVFRRKIYQ